MTKKKEENTTPNTRAKSDTSKGVQYFIEMLNVTTDSKMTRIYSAVATAASFFQNNHQTQTPQA